MKLAIRAAMIVLSGCLWPGSQATATQTDNHGLHAVPAPGTVTVDGRLDDWDLSGQTVMCYDLEHLRDTYSAEVAVMYDAANLYFGLHWKAPRPLSNHHDPRYQGDKGWAADSVQLRFRTDRIAHVTAWYFVDREEPAMQIAYGDDADPFGGPSRLVLRTAGTELEDGAAMAFRKDADGKGYVQEIRLPWALLTTGRAYRAGESFQCGVELLWGGADWPEMRYADNLMPGQSSREFFWTAVKSWGPVWLEPQGDLRLPTPDWLVRAEHATQSPPGPVRIGYTLPQDARVTIAIDDSEGRRVRNLIAAVARPEGRNTDTWDGLDDEGRLVPPGRYTYRAIYHDPIHLRWALSFANPGNPTWPTPDGRGQFYGDHSAPCAVATAGDGVALACPIGEAGQPLIGCDLDGQRRWGQANRVFFKTGIRSLATDGKVLFVGCDGEPPIIYRVELATGLYAPWNRVTRDANGHDFRVLDLPVPIAVPAPDDTRPGISALAYRDGELAVCLPRDDQVRLLDADTGEVRRTLAVRAPRSAAFDADGSLLVLSGEQLLRVSQGGEQAPFTAGDFAAGHGLAVDGQRRVYLALRGDEQCVAVFAPDGRELRRIGKPGGRPANGPYDRAGMLNPAQIAIDRLGRLWVTEEASNPKRTSLWDLETGALIKELVGTTPYAGAGGIDPEDPTTAFADGTVYRLDWEQGTSRPVYSLAKRETPDDLFPPEVHAITQRVIHHGADTLVYVHMGPWGVTQVTLGRDGAWRSAAAVGTVLDAEELRRNQYAPTEVRERFAHPLFEGHVGEAFAWADADGDGLVQAGELRFATVTAGGATIRLDSNYWGQLPGPDGTIPYYSRDAQALVKLPITGYTACGAPIYDPSRVEVLPLDQPVLKPGEGMILGGNDGVVYVNQDPLIAVDRDGHVLFTYPSHHVSVHGSHTAQSARPGYLIGPSSILGTAVYGDEIGEVFDLNGNLGENYLFTRDGLWIQALMRDVRGGWTVPERAERGVSFDDSTAGSESFGGNFVRTADGHTYLTIGGTDERVLEVIGLESLRRFGGEFTYTPDQFEQAHTQRTAQAAQAAEPKVYKVPRAAAPPVIDGRADDWPTLLADDPPAMEIAESPERRHGRVLARWDHECLYLAYRIFGASDHLRNVGQDDRLLFKTGDAVDLMLGPEPQVGLAGDLRLLLTVRGGQPVAVLNQKQADGARPEEGYVFTSWRTIAFDRVVVVPEVELAEGPLPGGCLVEAAIPWTTLGVDPRAGMTLRGDVGVLCADNAGTTTSARWYWSNQATALVSDVPGEADLTPELWGTLVLGDGQPE